MVRLNVEKLRKYINENYDSQAEFARAFGIDAGYLSKILSGDRVGQKLIIGLLKDNGIAGKDIFLP